MPVASFDSGIGARDRKMRDVTEAVRFPDVTFVSRTARPESWAGAPGSRRGRWRIAGDLTFHGVTRPAEALVDVREDGTALVAEGGFEVSLTAHGVARPRLGPAAIGDVIRLAFSVVALP